VAYNIVWWAVHDVETAAVGLPAGNPLGKMLIRKSEAAVVLFLKCVSSRAGNRISPIPKRDDETISLFVGPKLLEIGAFLIGDNPADVLVEPLAVEIVVCSA